MAQVKVCITTLDGEVLEIETLDGGGTENQVAANIMEVLTMRFDRISDEFDSIPLPT